MQTVTITTAQALSKEQLRAVSQLIEQKIGKATLVQQVDPKTIGGVRLSIGSQEFDVTVAGKLEKVQQRQTLPTVTTVVPLSSAQKKQIAQVLKEKTGSEEFESQIDPNIIGGIRLTVNSREYDATIKNKLEQLKQYMLQISQG